MMKTIKGVVNAVLTVFLLALFALGVRELLRFHELETEQASLKEEVVKIPQPDQGLDPEDPFYRVIDWGVLQAENPNIKGWIYIPGTTIDYPVMVGETDEYYLNRNYRGQRSAYGSIFGYSGVDLEQDNHICLFGHNMISRQMFGGLKNFRDQEFADSHRKMYIYTPGRTKECDLISVFRCHKTDEVFELDKTGEAAELKAEGEDLKKRSEISVSEPDVPGQIYTLSTCSGYTGTPYRLTVHFQVIQEKYVLE